MKNKKIITLVLIILIILVCLFTYIFIFHKKENDKNIENNNVSNTVDNNTNLNKELTYDEAYELITYLYLTTGSYIELIDEGSTFHFYIKSDIDDTILNDMSIDKLTRNIVDNGVTINIIYSK